MSKGSSLSAKSQVSPDPTYSMYQDPAMNPRATLATSTVNTPAYNDTYRDPALHKTLPPMMTSAANQIYSDSYQDPALISSLSGSASTQQQQTYEVPPATTEQTSPIRTYSALHRDDSGVTLCWKDRCTTHPIKSHFLHYIQYYPTTFPLDIFSDLIYSWKHISFSTFKLHI